MGNVEENTYKTKMSDQQDIFNIRKQMSSADHEVVTVSRNIVTGTRIFLCKEFWLNVLVAMFFGMAVYSKYCMK